MAQDAQPTATTYNHDDLRGRDAHLPPDGGAVPRSSAPNEVPHDAAPQLSLFELAEAAVRRNPFLAVAAVASVSALAVVALKAPRRPHSPFDAAMGDVGDRLRALERRALPQIRRTERQIQKSLKQSRLADGVADVVSAITTRLAALDTGPMDTLKARTGEVLQQVATKVGAR